MSPQVMINGPSLTNSKLLNFTIEYQQNTMMEKVICISVLCLVLEICHQVAGGRIELHSNNLGGAYHRFHANRDVNQVPVSIK